MGISFFLINGSCNDSKLVCSVKKEGYLKLQFKFEKAIHDTQFENQYLMQKKEERKEIYAFKRNLSSSDIDQFKSVSVSVYYIFVLGINVATS